MVFHRKKKPAVERAANALQGKDVRTCLACAPKWRGRDGPAHAAGADDHSPRSHFVCNAVCPASAHTAFVGTVVDICCGVVDAVRAHAKQTTGIPTHAFDVPFVDAVCDVYRDNEAVLSAGDESNKA